MPYSLRRLRWSFLGAVALLVPLSLAGQVAGHPSNNAQKAPSTRVQAPVSTVATWGVQPEEVGWVPSQKMPGVEIASLQSDPAGPYVIRVRLPDAYAVRAHRHGAQLLLTVLEGTYKVGFGTRADPAATVAFPAGSYVVIPAGVPHFAWSEGETIVQVASTLPINLDWATKK